jgi:glycerol-3-phosphate dehydrogenase (NAD(P)+)
MSIEEAEEESNGVAEGVPTTSAALTLAKQLGVQMPLAAAMDHVIHDGYTFTQMMGELFGSQIAEE